MMDATDYSFIALILFFALIIYLGVPKLIGGALDKRAKNIEDELSDARRLRDEAQALLAEYQRKREAAEKEAEEIVASAKLEAERIAEETRVALKEAVARRTKLAEEKIAVAEADAIKQVRNAATAAAIAATEDILSEKVKGAKATEIMDAAIANVSQKLN